MGLLTQDEKMIEQGLSMVFVKSIQKKLRSKRTAAADSENTEATEETVASGVAINTAIAMSNNTNPSEIDAAFDAIEDSDYTAQKSVEANPCFLNNLTNIGEPSHLELAEDNPDIYQSGFYAYFVCKRQEGTSNLMLLEETGNE